MIMRLRRLKIALIKDFKNYAALQELLFHAIKAESYEEQLETIKTVYGDDLDYNLLATQLELLPDTFQNGVSDLKELLKGCEVMK